MIRWFILILLILNCKSVDKPNWREQLKTKENIRFQIPVFEIENISREKRISISEEFALLWTKLSGYKAIVLDDKMKSDLLKVNGKIPSTNFAIQSKYSNGVLKLLIVDLETGEILSYGKTELSNEKEISNQLEKVIEKQLLKDMR